MRALGLLAGLAVACDGRPMSADAFDDPRLAGFVPDPDLGSDTLSFACNPFTQNCPAGEECMPWANDGGSAWNALRCSPVSPNPGAPGDPCTAEDSRASGIDDCERGAMCWDVDPATLTGTCVAMIVGSGVHPICSNPIDVPYLSSGHTIAVCLPGCHPLAGDCAPEEGCYPSDYGFVCMQDSSGDGGLAGDPCRFPNVCRDGLVCLNERLVPGCTGAGCCAPYCDLDGATCPAGSTCQPWADVPPPTPYQELVGICRA